MENIITCLMDEEILSFVESASLEELRALYLSLDRDAVSNFKSKIGYKIKLLESV